MLSIVTTEVAPRRRMTAEARREQILDITHAIVEAESFHAATVGRIADEAGVTRAVIYQQFGDLAGLFVALIDRESARAAADYLEAATGGDESEEFFVRTFGGVLRAIDAHPATWRLFLFPPQGAPPELHDRMARDQEALRGALELGLRTSYPDLPDPEFAARMVHAAGRELLQLRLTDPKHATPERILDAVRQVALSARTWARE